MDDMLEMKLNLNGWKRQIDEIKLDRIFRKSLPTNIKAGFREDQPRDEGGRWTLENGIEVSESPGFWTGIPTIDNTSQALGDTLARVMGWVEYLPTMTPGAYGVAVHTAFGLAVRLQNLPGVGDFERSFSLEDADPRYGLAGTIRTDLTLRDINGDIIAIYDVKTGDARISRSRADELREKTGASPNTPVFELNILHGISRKFAFVSRRDSTRRLWIEASISGRP